MFLVRKFNIIICLAMKKIIIPFVILISGMSGCINPQEKQESVQWDGPQHILESVLAVPDSVATPEQLALKQALGDIVWEYMIVKNNRLVLTADRAVFIERGIPPSYFDICQTSVEEMNDGLDRWEKESGLRIDLKEDLERAKKERELQKNAP